VVVKRKAENRNGGRISGGRKVPMGAEGNRKSFEKETKREDIPSITDRVGKSDNGE